MKTLQYYLEIIESTDDKYVVDTVNDIKIDLGNHARNRGNSRLAIDSNILLEIGRKIAGVFNPQNPDGMFGFYLKDKHVSGIFRFFKNTNKIKFITIFPDKKIQFFNNIDGMLVFNEEVIQKYYEF